MAGKTAVLAVKVTGDASDVTREFDDAGKAATKFGDKVDTAGGRAGDTSTAFSALAGALDASGFGPFAQGLDVASIALDASEGATILFRVATESLSISTIKDTAARIANTAATVASNVASAVARGATMAWTAAQWLLNAAMTANPIGLIIAAVVGLIAVIVLIATKTTWFQDIWRVAWAAIQTAASAVWTWLVKAATTAWNLLIAGVRLYVGIYIAIFQGIKTAVGVVWDWLKSAAGSALAAILAPIDAVSAAFDAVVDAIKSVIDWLAKIKLPKVLTDIGNAIGGIFGRSAAAPEGVASRSTGTARAAAGPAGLSARSFGISTRAATATVGAVVNVYVPETSDPVATARYLRKLLRRGEAAGVVFGTV